MAGQSAVTDAHGGNLCECGAHSGQQLGLQLALDAAALEIFGHFTADVLKEQHRVPDPVGVLTEAADFNIHVQTDILVYHTEGHGVGSAVLIAKQLLGVEVVNSLILGRLAAEGNTLAKLLEALLQALAQIAAENTGLGRSIIDILTGLRAEFHDRTLIGNDHSLAHANLDDGTGGDDIVSALGIEASGADRLLALNYQNILGNCIAAEKLFHLIGQNAFASAQQSTRQIFNKTHNSFLLL